MSLQISAGLLRFYAIFDQLSDGEAFTPYPHELIPGVVETGMPIRLIYHERGIDSIDRDI